MDKITEAEATKRMASGLAARRVRKAKELMDRAQRELDAAEDEWHQACRELDRIDGQ